MTRQLYTIHPGIGQQAIDYRGKDTGSRERNRFFFFLFFFFRDKSGPDLHSSGFWKCVLKSPAITLHYARWKGKRWLPPPPSRGCYCCWCCRLSIFFASSYCLSAFLNSCLYMEVADRRKRKRRVEWSKQRLKRKCVRGNQNTPASGEHFIFFYYKLFRGPTTLHPRRPHYTYTSNWARIFIYAPLHGWSMLFSERKNQRKRKKKKKNSRVRRPEVVGSS